MSDINNQTNFTIIKYKISMLNQSESRKPADQLTKKCIDDIRNAVVNTMWQNWYFDACVLTFPQTMIVEQQIRQVLFVFEENKPQQVIVVVLSEAAVRKYCNLLKPFTKIRLMNGAIMKSHLNNNFVFITQESAIHQRLSTVDKIFGAKRDLRNNLKDEKKKKYSVSLNIPNTYSIQEQDGSDQNSYNSNPMARSEKIQPNRQNFTQQLVNLCGTVIGLYQVGKGKMNHGIGYRVQQCFSKADYEVVVWCEMECDRLKKGKAYEFKNFRPHKKRNLEISYHSHPQYSTICLMN